MVSRCVFCCFLFFFFCRQGIFKSFHDAIVFVIGVFCVCLPLYGHQCLLGGVSEKAGTWPVKTGLKIFSATFFFSQQTSFFSKTKNTRKSKSNLFVNLFFIKYTIILLQINQNSFF